MEVAVLEKPIKVSAMIKSKKDNLVERIRMSYQNYDNTEFEDGFKYEWKNGFAIRNGSIMKNTERYIVINITKSFNNTNYYKNGDSLLPETRCKLEFLTTRIPDLAFFTKQQVVLSAQDEHPIPSFVVEIISKNENTFETEAKVQEYFEAGVQTIWQIFPTLKQVWVFADMKTVNILRMDEICSAAPALPDFKMRVKEIFEL